MSSTNLQFGIGLPAQHGRSEDSRAALDSALRIVRLAEETGWDSVFTGQHFLLDDMKMLQPVPYLARLAAETERIRLGLGICLLTLLNPVQAAEDLATLDVISGGRLIVGVGLGYREAEYSAFGVARSEQVRRLTENLRVVKDLWDGGPVDADLDWCRIQGAVPSILPVQEPRPPIWMAAHVDAAVRRAARTSDAWYVSPHVTHATVKRQMTLFREERRAHGLPAVTEVPVAKEIYCAPTRDDALDVAARYVGGKYAAYARWGQDEVLPEEEGSFTRSFDELSSDRFIVGDPQSCREQLKRTIVDVGATHLVFRVQLPGMPEELSRQSMQLLASDVLPALRELELPLEVSE